MGYNMRRRITSAGAALAIIALFITAGSANALKQGPATPLDLNRATAEELAKVPGLGPAKAKAIVNYRSQKPFSSLQDLVNVKGVGDKLLVKISPFLTVALPPGSKQP